MRKWIIAGTVGVLALGAVGVLISGVARAQDKTPQTPGSSIPFNGRPGPGWGIGDQVGLEAAAEALGISARELATQLWGGRTLADLAKEKGVSLEAVQVAIDAARGEAMRQAIQQAVDEGNITQEHADWLLEGIDQGFEPGFRFGEARGPGFKGDRDRGLGGDVGLGAAAEALGMTSDELSAQLWGGKTLADLAQEKGVDLSAIQAAVGAAQEAAIKDSIQQAVEGGSITQNYADWLLEGLEKDFIGGPGRGVPFMGGGFHGRGPHEFGEPGMERQLAPSDNS